MEDLEALDVTVEPANDAPAALAAGDAVPRFRADLCVERGASGGLYDVSDPATGRRFTLYEFELSIARMLDGRRAAADVVEHGVRLGIPVDLGSLHKFVRQLWHYGFLAPQGTPAGDPGGTWPAREAWDEATRALFQSGLRLLRAGRGADAAAYFEAVLDAHPADAEATEMLAVASRGKAPAPAPEVGEEGEPPARRAARPRRALLVAGVLGAAVAGAGIVLALRAPPVPAPPPASPSPALAASAGAPPPPPAPAPAAPRWRSAPIEALRHPPLAELVAPAAGTARWRKAPGAVVARGEVVAELGEEGGARAPRADLARRVAELEALAAQDPVYRDFLEKARREARRAARGPARAAPLVAPADGLLELAEGGGPRARKGEVLGRVLDPARWRLDAVLEGAPPPLDAACEVEGEAGARAPCRIVEAAAAGDARTALAAELAAADATRLGHAASLRVREGPPPTALASP